MIARIQKWGNSLGVRIPKNVAQDARIQEGSSVDLSVEEGRLISLFLGRVDFTLS
jgi:antitoxin MazE